MINEDLIRNLLETVHAIAQDIMAYSDIEDSTWNENCYKFHFASHGVAIANLCTHLQEILDKGNPKISYEINLKD